jgi:hypothetical protein
VKYTLDSADRVPGGTLEDDLRVFEILVTTLPGDMLRQYPQNNSEKRTSQGNFYWLRDREKSTSQKLSTNRKKERNKVLYNFKLVSAKIRHYQFFP